MSTNVKRRPAAKKVDFYWFRGESVRELASRLTAANPDTARLEVRLAGDKMTLTVVPESEVTASRINPPINDSHVCPPQCP